MNNGLLLHHISILVRKYKINWEKSSAAFDMPDSYGLLVFETIIDFCFLTDIILRFVSSYVDSENQQEVTNFKQIALQYLK